ncbi:pyruvate dehydrogenase complex dihydrolipoamide acetyltransferase [Cupriavidus oxalaticus]|uniref:Acetyltransferase component of pyruvate dehydrogenase complex n=1 Tax=Cupriavidus oxalaticus TaxID=96344 RepID=A0A976BDY8_9BURK|nr:pyruvate dehydrogenase complex dihydrolipoamide acetyltransferase [Cupriavidus oxalaticus]QRQ87703.1 pyruvate dehydrogenase complex dihydrolipoamide acetyltransferase [Cupriavidus oxalaticus]QRQ93970.1 pyruvate dehydrogenase complex dihydrolipoamide acetyltransferase [Cupriavidus oxalaticus]WQD82604.1 pyruvate dehydrogenase complex dihydrolipoamide acetyltransferase [Cupriavidus oxalaticus]SPC15098.1 Dihydrolipoyllysine-residue acetyltransferase component of pyruvate dehydrogenase complex [C
MAILLRMPEVAANATHATLQAWTRQEGDKIAVGDCIAEIETDKAIVELNADTAGTLGRMLVRAGQEVEVGAPIGVLLVNGETHADIDALLAASGGIAVPESQPLAQEPAVPVAPLASEPATAPARIFASPLARRLAAQRGLDLATLAGSGPNGRIVRRDVEAARAEALTATPAATPIATPAPAAARPAPVRNAGTDDFIEIPHSNMRRTIARRLAESKSTIPHFYLSVDCRMDRLLALRAEINAGAARKISVNDFVVRAVAVALREVPEANVAWTDTAMRQFRSADIAVAVSTDTGLITPIVRAADSKPLSVISAEIAELAARARAGQLRPDEYQGGSFSVSNLGMHGVAEFSAIINPPEAAILAVGVTQPMPVVRDGQVEVAQVMRCTLSVDHRAIDGALAAKWLAAFRRLLENPLAMLV